MLMRFHRKLSRLMPAKYRRHVGQMLVFAGEKRTTEYWLGYATLFGLVFFAVATALPLTLSSYVELETIPLGTGSWVIGLVAFVFVHVVVYMMIYFKIQKRTERVEKSLPDALQLVAANVRAGMTPFQALKFAARDEFGPLKEEIEYATTKALGTENFSEALMEMSERIKSGILNRSLGIFVSSMKSGGHLAKILEGLSMDISEMRSLKKELVTNTKTYTMLIVFTIVIGTPFLSAVSVHFIRTMTAMQANTGDVGFGMSFLTGKTEITEEFLVLMIYLLLIVTSVSAGVMMGVIKEGDVKYGLRYAPFICAVSLVIFLVSQNIVASMF